MEAKPKKKFQMPSAYTTLFIIIAAMAVLTWFIPAGSYETQEDERTGRQVVVPGSYTQAEAKPQGLWDVLLAPVHGMEDAVGIAFFILMIGGFLGVVNKTGALNAGLASTIRLFRDRGREKMLIPVLMVLFALGGSTYGMAEETIPFYAIVIPVMLAIKLDTIVAVAIVLVGSQVGALASTVNPFATGVASGILGLSPGQGIGLRILMLVVLTAVSILYVYRYARRIEKDPSKSLVYAQREDDLKHFDISALEKQPEITKRQKTVNALFFAAFVIMIVSLVPWSMLFENFTLLEDITAWLTGIPALGVFLGKSMVALGDWYFPEITMLFMVMAIIVAFAYGFKEREFASAFIAGSADMVGVAMVVAVGRGIQIVMNNGMITHTILHWGEQGLSNLPPVLFILLAFVFYLPMSFLIPSTSGLASATMGIMGPMGELAGVSPELVITAFQSASGVTNYITPASAVVMGALTIARFDLGTWCKFVGGLIGIQIVIICVMLGVAAVL